MNENNVNEKGVAEKNAAKNIAVEDDTVKKNAVGDCGPEAAASNAARRELLNELLFLKYSPVALKLVGHGDRAPEDAYRPADHGRHIALCQAFALARRNGKTVYMRKEDHWCWNPLITFGHVKCEEKSDPGFDAICDIMGMQDRETAERFVSAFRKLPYGRYDGVLVAPLDQAGFAPDLILIYCDNEQLRTILLATRQSGKLVKGEFDAVDSCLYSVIPPLTTGEYRVTVPDIGEYERALLDGNEAIIFSVPAARMDEFFRALGKLLDSGVNSRIFLPSIKEDFARPPFYNEVFAAWGLDTGEDWEK